MVMMQNDTADNMKTTKDNAVSNCNPTHGAKAKKTTNKSTQATAGRQQPGGFKIRSQNMPQAKCKH